VGRDLHLVSEIGQAARAAFGKVFEGWDAEADWPIKRTVEAQIAAACLGYKPLYWDPWGEEASVLFRFDLGRRLGTGATIDASANGLLIFQPAVVARILDSDPDFYRPHQENALAAVRRITGARDNGELLGYGARNVNIPGALRVRIFDDNANLFASFVSLPEVAEFYARERLLDIATYIGADLSYSID
jgi:hypothetical protein